MIKLKVYIYVSSGSNFILIFIPQPLNTTCLRLCLEDGGWNTFRIRLDHVSTLIAKPLCTSYLRLKGCVSLGLDPIITLISHPILIEYTHPYQIISTIINNSSQRNLFQYMFVFSIMITNILTSLPN